MEPLLTQITHYLFRQSWHIALLIAAVAAVAYLARNRSAHLRYLLWLIVLAKCLVPPLYTVPLAVLPQRPASEPVVATPVEEPPLSLELIKAARPQRYISPALAPEATRAPAPEPVTSTGPTIADRLAEVSLRQWLGLGWIAGASLFVLLALIKAWRTNRWLRRDRRPLPENTKAKVDRFFCELGIRTRPKVWLITGVGQPFVWGVLRGSIYLPGKFEQVNGPAGWRGILGHELSHVMRFDAAVNLLQVVAQAVYWFHPLVWWANKRVREEREKCCDEMAIARLNTRPRDYSTAIVNTLVAEHKAKQPVPSLAVAGPVKNIEDRIKTIMKSGKKFYRRPTFITIVTIGLLAGIAVPTTLALTSREKETARERTAAEAETNCGKAVDGLQAGLRVKEIIESPQPRVVLSFSLRNVGNEPIRILRLWEQSRLWGPCLPLEISVAGRTLTYHGPVLTPPPPPYRSAYIDLARSQVDSVAVAMAPKYWGLEDFSGAEFTFVYQKSSDSEICEYDNKEKKWLSITGLWTGKLRSNMVKLDKMVPGPDGTSPTTGTDVGGLLPGSGMTIEQAVGSPVFTLAAVCEALDEGGFYTGDEGTWEGWQNFKVMEVLTPAGRGPEAGKEVPVFYRYFDHPGLRERPIRKGEQVLWIMHFRKSAGYNGAKALADTDENRAAVTDLAAWGAAVEGLRCRWIGPKGPVVVGEKPEISMEVENVSDKPIFWECRDGFTLRIIEPGSPGSARMPRFKVSLEQGVRELTPAEIQEHFATALSGYYCLERGARMTIATTYPWPLAKAGPATIEGYLMRKNPGGSDFTYPEGLILCPPLVIDVVDSNSDRPREGEGVKGLEFLEGVPEFRGLRLDMTERQLRLHIKLYSLAARFSKSGEETTYHLYTGEGENVIVMFRNGQCTGIQRMRPDRDAALRLFEEKRVNEQKAFSVYNETCQFLYEGGDRTEAAKRFGQVAELAPATEYGASARELAIFLKQMAAEQRPQIDLPGFDGDVSPEQLIADLIFDLRDVAVQAFTVPGKCRVLRQDRIAPWSSHPNPAQRLSQLAKSDDETGRLVVERMMQLLTDRRPTRSWSGALNGGHVLRYCDVALEILANVAGARLPNGTTTFDPRTERGAYLGNADDKTRKEIIARVNAWWAERQGAKAETPAEASAEGPIPWSGASGASLSGLKDDLELRLETKKVWKSTDVPRFRVHVPELEPQALQSTMQAKNWHLQIDGIWCELTDLFGGREQLVLELVFEAGQEDRVWRRPPIVSVKYGRDDAGPTPELAPGTHTICFAFTGEGEDGPSGVAGVSNPVEIEILSDVPSGRGGRDDNWRKQALEQAGARLTLDSDGEITQIYFGSKATDEGLSLLKGLKKLKRLYLETGKISDGGLVNLEGLTSLEYLSLYETPITDAGLVHVGKLADLRELILEGTKSTERGLVHLKGLTKLEDLNPGWNAISDDGLRQLSEMRSLKSLDLLHTEVSAKGLEYFAILPKLERLTLGNPAIDDSAAEMIGKMKELRMLELRFTGVSDAGMKHIARLSKLEQLSLSSRQVTNAGLAYIKGLCQLRMVELRGPHFGDESLKYFVKLPRLERLDIADMTGGSGYTAGGLALLEHIKTLRSLWLYGWHVGEGELEQLCTMKNLEELTLSTDNLDIAGGDLRDRALRVRGRLRLCLPQTQIDLGPFGFKLPDIEKEPAADSAWGEAVDGVQCRLRTDKEKWEVGETPTLKADMRNLGSRQVSVVQHEGLCEIWKDGRWYLWEGSIDAKSSALGPGRQFGDIPVRLDGHWVGAANGKPLRLSRRHLVRIAFITQSQQGEIIRVHSNPVLVEILPGGTGRRSVIGGAVDEVGARFRAARVGQRRTTFIGLDLTDAPRTTSRSDVPELFHESPAGSRNYVLRDDVIAARHPEFWEEGVIYYASGKKQFYIVVEPGHPKSSETFYGPFEGEPWKRFGMTEPQPPKYRHRLAIYLVVDPISVADQLGAEDSEPVDIGQLRLASAPVLSEQDIIEYEWDEHLIKLRPEARNRLPSPRSVWGLPFVVVADGERCYLGAFWSHLASYMPKVPAVYGFYAPGQENEIQIQVTPNGVSEDPRNDPRIRRVLERLGALSKDKTKAATMRRTTSAAVYRQLSETVDVSQWRPETSFGDALEELKKSVEPPLNIVVLWRDLEENATIDRTTPINMEGVSGIYLVTALRLLLRSVSASGTEIDFVIKDGIIVIGTKEALPNTLETRTYDIYGLVALPVACQAG